jgi:hypothetical protein
LQWLEYRLTIPRLQAGSVSRMGKTYRASPG